MFKKLVLNIGSKAIVVISQFVVLILSNHIIGPEGRGVFIAAITWANTFFIFSNLSLNSGILNLSHQHPGGINDLAHNSVISALLFGLASGLLGWSIYFVYPPLFNNIPGVFLFLALAAIPFMMLQQYIMAILQVAGKFNAFNLLYAAYSITNLVGICMAWVLGIISVASLVGVNLVAWVVTGLIALYQSLPFLKQRTTALKLRRLLWKTGLAAHFGAIVTFVISRSDILIVNYFSNERQTGIYGLAVGMIQMLFIVPLSIQNLLFHSLIGKQLEIQKKIVLQHSRFSFALMTACAIAMAVFARVIVYIIGGKDFEAAVPLFKYLLPAMVVYSVPMILSTQWTIMGIFKKLNISFLTILAVSVIGNIILVPFLGIEGAAISFLVIAILNLFIHIYFVRKYLGIHSLADILIIKKADIKPILDRYFRRKADLSNNL